MVIIIICLSIVFFFFLMTHLELLYVFQLMIYIVIDGYSSRLVVVDCRNERTGDDGS